METVRRSYKLRLAFLLLLIVVSAAVKVFYSRAGVPVQIYYTDKNNLFLVPMTRRVKSLAPNLLAGELEKSPNHPQLFPAVPPLNGLMDISGQGTTLVVNFKKEVHLEKWPLALKAMVATFKQLSNFNEIEFLIDGKPNMLFNGIELGRESFSQFWINDNDDPMLHDSKLTEESQKLTVYYLMKGTTLLVPLTQRFPAKAAAEEVLAQAFENSIPFGWAFASPLPQGSHILSVSRPSKETIVLKLDLSGSKEEKAIARKAVRLSYAEIPSVLHVKIHEKGNFFQALCASGKPSVINRAGGRP